MKKKLTGMFLIFCLLGATPAYATGIPVVDALKNAFDIAYKAAEDAWKEAKDAWEESVWGQQAKDMVDTINEIKHTITEIIEAKNKLTGEITGVMSTVTNIEDSLASYIAATPGSEIDYSYAKRSPDDLITGATCLDGADCVIAGVGYTGIASDVSSFALRNALKVNPSEVGASLVGGKTIAQISREAAEINAQEVAVINAMAHEAFTQSTNRIKSIEILKSRLIPASEGGTGPEGEENSLKYIADIQGQIQAEQAYLINDQNKLTALTVLQQSQHDMYEQRKKEITNYISHDDRADQVLERAAITVATKAAYEALENLYD